MEITVKTLADRMGHLDTRMDYVRSSLGLGYEDPNLTSGLKKSVTFQLEDSVDTTFNDQNEDQNENLQLIAAEIHQDPVEMEQPPPLPKKSPKKTKPVGISVPLTTRPRLLKKSKKEDSKSGYMEMKAALPPKKPPRVEAISPASPVLEPLLSK